MGRRSRQRVPSITSDLGSAAGHGPNGGRPADNAETPPVEARAPLLLRPAEAAEQLRVSRAQAYRLIESKEIPSIRVGSQLRVPRDALREWIARRLAESSHS